MVKRIQTNMRTFNKLWGISPPRHGNQTLQECIGCVIVPRKDCCWHSVGVHLHDCMAQPNARASVETFYHPTFLERCYPNSLFILSIRDKTQWLRSCANIYHKSTEYNHPLWKHSLDYFSDYYDEYMLTRLAFADQYPDRCLVWDLFKNPTWGPLCNFLQTPEPQITFPHIDDHQPTNILYNPLDISRDEFGLI